MAAQYAGEPQRKRYIAVSLLRLFLIFHQDSIKSIENQRQKHHRRILSDSVHRIEKHETNAIKSIQKTSKYTDPAAVEHPLKTIPRDKTGHYIDK